MESSHAYERMVSLISSMFVSLVAGTPYLYGVYSPQLVQRVGLSMSDAATMSVAVNIGSGLGGLPAGLFIDRFGPQKSVLLGSVCIFTGYYSLNRIYVHQISSLFFICLLMAMMGFGSVTSFFAGLKAAQANFPDHRGSAGALPVGAYGLAATLFSFIAAKFFDGNSGELLLFLSCFCGSVAFTGSWFIHIYPVVGKAQDELDEVEDPEPIATPMVRDNSLRGSFSFWGIGTRTPRSSVYLMSSDLAPLVDTLRADTKTLEHRASMTSMSNLNSLFVSEDSSINQEVPAEETPAPPQQILPVKRKHPPSDEGAAAIIKWLLSNKTFLAHYAITALSSGVSQMYVYTVGFIVTAQFNYKNPDPEGSPAALQAVQVSTISIASFAGRVTAGVLSDYIYKKLGAQRQWVILVTIALNFIAQIMLILTNSLHQVTIISLLVGAAYGLLNGTYPAIIADSFGTSTFTTAWGLICSGPLLVLFSLEKYFGFIYDSQSDEIGLCTKGNDCYKGAFEVSSVICVVTMVLTGVLMVIKRRTSDLPQL